MPYKTNDDLPAAVKKLPEKKQSQWREVFNSAYADCTGDDCDASAARQAWGVVNKGKKDIELWDVWGRQVSQADAEYDPLGASGEKGCANCNWFVSPDSCLLVSGEVSPTGTSKYWTAKPVYEPQPVPVVIVKEKSFVKAFVSAVRAFLPQKRPTGHSAPHPHPFRDSPASILFKSDDGTMYWTAAISNNFRDRTEQAFSAVAHKDYVGWVNEGGYYPPLLLWHTPELEIGQTEWVDTFIDGDDVVVWAGGTIYKDCEPLLEKVADEDLAMSHGFVYAMGDDGVIHLYRSFEYSVLPRSHCANVATSFNAMKGLREMPFSEDRKKWFVEKLGMSEAEVGEFEKSAAETVDMLRKIGIESKDIADGDLTVKPLLAAMKDVAGKVEALQGTIATMTTDIAALKQSDDEKIASHMQAQIDKAPVGHRASEDASNVVPGQQREDDLEWFKNGPVAAAQRAFFGKG